MRTRNDGSNASMSGRKRAYCSACRSSAGRPRISGFDLVERGDAPSVSLAIGAGPAAASPGSGAPTFRKRLLPFRHSDLN